MNVWHGMDHSIVDTATDEWCGHLSARVRANDGHFMHLLLQYQYPFSHDKKRFICCQL